MTRYTLNDANFQKYTDFQNGFVVFGIPCVLPVVKAGRVAFY